MYYIYNKYTQKHVLLAPTNMQISFTVGAYE